jgi:hypothetical protein
VGDGANSRGPVVREITGRRPAQEGVNRIGKRISHEYAIDARGGWAGRAISACGDGAAGGLGQRPSGPWGRPGRKSEKRNF